MSLDEPNICYVCGADTVQSSGICNNCLQHKERHTEMKDRSCLAIEIMQSPNYESGDDR